MALLGAAQVSGGRSRNIQSGGMECVQFARCRGVFAAVLGVDVFEGVAVKLAIAPPSKGSHASSFAGISELLRDEHFGDFKMNRTCERASSKNPTWIALHRIHLSFNLRMIHFAAADVSHADADV